MVSSKRSFHGEMWVPTCLNVLAEARDQILAIMKLRGYTPADTFAVGIALDEALTNAAVHGNASDCEKQIRICYRICAEETHVEIEDEGAGFDFESVPDPRVPALVDQPHGRGVFLMRTYMSRVDYNERGNCIAMLRRRGDCARAEAALSARRSG